MSDRFKELFEEARNSGIDPDWLDRFESNFEASPLRKDNQEVKEKYRDALNQNARLRDTILETRFKEHGVTISPSALRIPDDLDPTDPEKVEGWLVQSGLAQPKPTTDPETRATHDRIAAASTDMNPGVSAADLPDPSKMSEDEWWAKAQQLEEQRLSNR